jgi:hypothetical protein
VGDDSVQLPALIERLDAMKEDAPEVSAEGRRLRVANRRLLAQIRNGDGRNSKERRAAPQAATQQQQHFQPWRQQGREEGEGMNAEERKKRSRSGIEG